MSHTLETVQSIYQAFGRGDVPAILAVLADEVRWEDWADNSAQAAGVPLMLARRGRQQVAGFFQEVGKLQIHEFKVLDIIAGERQVAVEFSIDFTVPGTGVRVAQEEVHLWSFGADGKVSRFRHYLDTARLTRAFGLGG